MEGERPKNLRTILLAYPKRTRRTRKYVPPLYTPGIVDSGVSPSTIAPEVQASWRVTQLANSVPRKTTPKYVYVEESLLSGLSPETLAGGGTSRSWDLSRPVIRYLRRNKQAFSFLGTKFHKNVDKKIEESWNCIYNYYKKQWVEIERKRKLRLAQRKLELRAKSGKGPVKQKSPEELKKEREKKFAEWVVERAKPKKIFKPPPPPKRKIADLKQIHARMLQLSEPRIVTNKYTRPSIDPTYIDPLRVSQAARTYVPSERVLELSRQPAWRLVKIPELIPGAVCRGALRGPVPPKFAELAVPKKKAAEKDNDLKENPFMISKNALKYVATARILELSKPIDR